MANVLVMAGSVMALVLTVFMAPLTAAAPPGFLSDLLPLTASIVPMPSASQSSMRLGAHDSITVIFSRPMIALGQDFDPTGDPLSTDPLHRPLSLAVVDASGAPLPGVPIPAGRFRWVSTTIARFDPMDSWPLDLYLGVTVAADLETYDGVAFAGGAVLPAVLYHTDSLRLWNSQVTSEMASAATGNQWDGTFSLPAPGLECPPDAAVTLTWNTAVDVGMLATALQLSPAVATMSVTTCAAYDANPDGDTPTGDDAVSSCVVVLPRNLATGSVATLSLPAGSRYHPLAGRTPAVLSVTLYGLRPFDIPFYHTPANPPSVYEQASFRRLHMWLRHGLADTATGLAKLQAGLTLTDSSRSPVPATLTMVTDAVVQLEAELQPDTVYTITLAADATLTDGFGLPFQGATGMVHMGEQHGMFSASTEAVNFPADAVANAVALSRVGGGFSSPSANGHPYIAVAAVPTSLSATDFAAVLQAATQYRHAWDAGVFGDELPASMPPPTVAYGTSSSAASATVVQVPLPQRGVAVQVVRSGRYSIRTTLVSATDLCAAFTALSSGAYTAWVTVCDTAAPVAGAEVHVYRHSHSGSAAVVRLLSGTSPAVTNGDGVAHFTVPVDTGSRHFSAMLRHAATSDMTFVEYLPEAPAPPASHLRAVVLTDRVVYKPGDTVHVKGYLRDVDVASLSLSLPASGLPLSVAAQWHAQTPRDLTPATVVDATGSFAVDLTVPHDADYGDVALAVQVAGDFVAVEGHAITVADPRPPTVALTVEAGVDRVDPAAPSLPLTLTTASYLGFPSPHADVTLTYTVAPEVTHVSWRFGLRTAGVATPTAAQSASVTVSTGANGRLDHALDLSGMGAADGSTVTVVAVWIGPTGERVTQTLEVPVAAAGVRLGLQAPLPSDAVLPGVAVATFATVRAVVPSAAGEDVVVTVGLWRWAGGDSADGDADDDTVTYRAANGDAVAAADAAVVAPPPPASGGSWAPLATCVVTVTATTDVVPSTSDARCGVTLPSMGRFALVATATDPTTGHLVGAGTAIGWEVAAWTAAPLSALPAVDFTLDQDAYHQADTMQLSFVNPVRGAKLLTVVGFHSPTTTVHTLPDAPGSATVPVAVGDDCAAHCSLTAVVVAPPQALSDVLPVPVPVSVLLDAAAPRTFSAVLPVTVLVGGDDSALEGVPHQPVGTLPQLTVVPTLADPVTQPGATTSLHVAVTDADGAPVDSAELLVAITDQAMLDVKPPPARTVHAAMAVPRATTPLLPQVAATCGTRSFADAVSASLDTLRRRADADPWATPAWALLPHAHADVDQTDAAFFADLFHAVTPVPYIPTPYAECWECDPLSVDFADEAAEFESVQRDAAFPSPAAGGVAPDNDAPQEEASATSAASDGAAPSSALQAPELATRTAFDTTPVFVTVTTGADGMVSVPVELPDNVGTFAVKVVAVAPGTSAFGQADDASITVRRALTVQPALPRAVRLGDTFTAGGLLRITTVEDGEDEDKEELSPYTVTVDVALQGDVAGAELLTVAAASQTLVVLPGEQARADFVFTAAADAVGDCRVTLQARVTDGAGAAADASDAVEAVVPVRPVWPEVSVATSFALDGGDGAVWQEGLALPESVRGYGGVTVTAGVGHLAGIMGLLPTVMPLLYRTPTLLRSSAVVASLVAAPVVTTYGLPLGDSTAPAAASPESVPTGDDVAAAAAAQFDWSVARLRALTSAACGLRYAAGASCYRPSVPLNAVAVAVARRTATLLPSSTFAMALPEDLVASWSSALDAAVATAVESSVRWRYEYADWWSLSQVMAAEGTRWVPASLAAPYRSRCSYATLLSAVHAGRDTWSTLPLARTAVAAVLDAMEEAGSLAPRAWPAALSSRQRQQLDDLVRSLYNRVRVQGRTAYVSAPGSGFPEDTTAQAVALLAMAHAPTAVASTTVVPKLAHYVATGGHTGHGVYVSAEGTAMVALALAAYDGLHGSTRPDVDVVAVSGGHTLLQQHLGPGAVMASRSTPWSALQSPPRPVQLRADGSGQVFTALSLEFVPVALPTSAMYRGLYVEMVVQRQDATTGKGFGDALQVVERGATVVVTVQVTSPDSLSDVTVTADLPGGLEPVDAQVDATVPAGLPSGCAAAHGWWWWWCVPTFSNPRVTPSSVSWESTLLAAGAHTVSFTATVVTQGVFVMPPARAFVQAQPEVMGTSAGATFVVTDTPVASVDVPALLSSLGVTPRAAQVAAPTSCPSACDPFTACDLSVGACVNVTGVLQAVALLGVPPPALDDGDGGGRPPVGALAGAVVAGVAFVVVVVVVVVVWRRRVAAGFNTLSPESPSPSPARRSCSTASPSTVVPEVPAATEAV